MLRLSRYLILILILQQIVAQDKTKTTTTTTTTTTTARTTTTRRPSTAATQTSTTTTTTTTTPAATITATTIASATTPYCASALCELYNGTHITSVPHIACANNGTFGQQCGIRPHLLYMSERRRQLILDMHNLARSRIAAGQLTGYKAAAHMPALKWDNELAYLASLHVKRCQFAHDKCRNTLRYPFSGQNIGYFWIGREFKSHSRRMKSFVINWYREYIDANQTFIDSYRPHPQGKKIGHFTLLVADRVHRVGCAAIRYRGSISPQLKDESKYQFLMTCNYDYNNIINEPIYQTGKPASKCAYKVSDKFPALCDWKDAVYDYDSEESVESDGNLLDNNIPLI